MNDLIKINYETEQPTVSARDLYNEVGTTERFASWFERQLQFGFEVGTDYLNPKKVLRVQIEGNREVQREVEDYDLTISMAKEVCMLQKNSRARQIRQYLIKLDEAWNTPEQVMARALKMANQTIDKLKSNNAVLIKDIQRMKPKEVFADAVSASHTSILIGDLAKLLKQNGYETGQKRLFEQLRQEGYLIKGGSSRNMPTQISMDMNLFEVKETSITNPDGSVRVTKTTKVTGKGQQYFINRYLGERKAG